MKSSLILSLLLISTSALADDIKKVESNSDKIDYKLVQIESRIKEISQKISLKAQAPKREEVIQDNRQEKLDNFKQHLVNFTEGLDQRQLFIRHEIKRTFQKFLSSSNPWNEIEGLSRNISFYTKAIPNLNVTAESKAFALAEIQKLNAEAQAVSSLRNVDSATKRVVETHQDNTELVQAGSDLLYLQNDIQAVREDVAQLAVSKIQNARDTAPTITAEEKSLFEKTKYISLGFFFIGSVILGFVMRGKTSPRRKIAAPRAATQAEKKKEIEDAIAANPAVVEEPTFKLPPLPVDMGLSSNEMEEYLNYLDIPILVVDENNETVWGNNSSRRNSLNAAKYESLKAEGLIDSLGYPVVINNSILYRVATTQVPHSCWSGKTVTFVQLVPHEYSQVEFSSIKNKGKFISDLKATKEQNDVNTVLVETVDRFKYLFAQSNISFDYLPLDESAFINMKRDDLDRYCRDVIYMINRLVLDSHQKHELLLEAKLNDNRVHFKFYLMNYSYNLQPEQQERLNNEFGQLHTLENSLSAYQGRLTLRTLKGEISSLEIDLSFNLYPTGSTYANTASAGATV